MSNIEYYEQEFKTGLPIAPEEDLEIIFKEDEDKFATFDLKFKEFDRFADFDSDTRVYVILKGGKQNIGVECGLLEEFRVNRHFSFEEHKNRASYEKTEKTIVGVPNRAEVYFISPSGKKLYKWQKSQKRDIINGGTGTGKKDRKLIDHHKRKEEMERVLSFDFDREDKKVRVEWNLELSHDKNPVYNTFTSREKLLMSQFTMTEILNYVILTHQKEEGGIQYDQLNANDTSSLSAIKQFLIYIDKSALDLFKKNGEKITFEQYTSWKNNMLDLYCKEMRILLRLAEK